MNYRLVMSCQGCSVIHNYILAGDACNKHIRAVIMKVLQQAKVKRNYKLEWMKIDNDKFGLQPGEYLCLDWKSYLDYALDFVKTARIHKWVSQSVKVSDAVWKADGEHRVKLPSFLGVDEIWHKEFCMDGIDRYFIKLKCKNVMIDKLNYEIIAKILGMNLHIELHVGKNNILWAYANDIDDLYISHVTYVTEELVIVKKKLVKHAQWQTIFKTIEL